MTVFWEKGYDGASMRDLTAAMGITGPSLYAAYGDKSELYLKTVDHYSASDACTPLVVLESEEDIEKALQAFLCEVIDSATGHKSGEKGCYITSSAIASTGQVDGLEERVRSIIGEAENRLTARFQKEIDKGTLPADFPARARASMLFDLRQGYMFRARAGGLKEEMLKDVPDRIRLLLSK
ncbi:MAG: TetR/AcrR family transcriptional regulator [Rhodobacteraceae bacterium]|nr:TetR/AcrR family transcriptional regulator [Paracoccaceae bacterium]